MSASVATSPSALKSAESQVGQQLPAMHAKKASISASVAVSPSWLKSAEPQQGNVVNIAPPLSVLLQAFETLQRTVSIPKLNEGVKVRVADAAPDSVPDAWPEISSVP